MKLKFREDKIAKLETEHQISHEDELLALREELKLANQQIEQERTESNPKIS